MAFLSGQNEESHAIIKALLGEKEARGVTRLVLDIAWNDVVKIYVERFADAQGVADAVEPCAVLQGRVEVLPIEEFKG